jgi:hypothetical protein
MALRPGQAAVALLHVPLDCDYVESRQGLASWRDEANWSSFLPLCKEREFRAQLRARVLPAFRARFASLTGGTGIFEEAFVSFIAIAKPYVDLVEWALVAASEFSTRPTVLFVSAGDLARLAEERFSEARFPRLVAVEFPLPTLHPWFDKLRAVLLAPVSRAGIVIEADTLVTHHADRFFGVVRRHARQFPLLPQHPDERLPTCYDYRGNRMCINPLPYPAHERSMPYLHAHVMFSAESKAFLARALQRCLSCTGGDCDLGGRMCGNDEHAINYLMWRERAATSLCLMDPTFTIVDNFERSFLDDSGLEINRYLGRRGFAIGFVHGCKDPVYAKDIVNRLRFTRKLPWIVLKGQFVEETPEAITELEALDRCVFTA